MPSIDTSSLGPARFLREALLALALGVLALVGSPAGATEAPGSAGLAEAGADTPWRTARLWGAEVWSLAVHPHDPHLVFAGTAGGHVYASRDGGESWMDAGAPLPFPGWVVSALAFDPNRPERLWATLRGVWGGGHVAFSDDLGERWEARGADLAGHTVYSLALVPGVPGKLYAGTADGVWGSLDDGRSWKKLTGAHPELAKVTSLLVPPGEPEAVVAGTWRRAYRSDDGGITWRGVFEGMRLDSEVFSLFATNRPGEMWASTCNWVYQSLDGGNRWERFEKGMNERRATAVARLPWGRVLSGTVRGLYVSDDGGASWTRRTGPEISVLTLAVHPGRAARVYLGAEGSGVWISDDGAETFRRAAVGMTNTRVAAIAETSSGEVYAAANHAGAASGVYRSDDGGRTFAARTPALPTVLALAAEPAPAAEDGTRGADLVWAATERGLFVLRGGAWQRTGPFGERRVDDVVVRDGRLVVRADGKVWERSGGGFEETAYRHGPPRSATLQAGALWVTDAAGLYRVAEGSNHTAPAPAAGGRVVSLGERLLYIAKEAAWIGRAPEEPWRPLEGLRRGPVAAFETGDGRHPVLLADGERAYLYDTTTGTFRTLELPFPARELADAGITRDRRLLLGTLGHGLIWRELDPRE